MLFTVIPVSERSRRYRSLAGEDEAFLVRDNWDDYGYKTTFSLIYFTPAAERIDLGEVKIMQTGMRSGYTPLNHSFGVYVVYKPGR